MTDVRPARDAAEVRAALALRHEVFVVEQRVPVEEEIDRHDDTALHLVAVDGGRVVATCRLVEDGATVTLGRMAVAASARRRGLASALLAEAEARARALGATRIALAAQTGALRLYEQAGYTAYGERFLDAGIDHLMMEKRLTRGAGFYADAMPEVRVDPLTGLKSIVTPDRAGRPGGGLSAEPCPPIDRETDPFADGHESQTPPEVYAVRPDGGAPDSPGWKVRVVPNLYPALDPEAGEPEPFAKRDLFTAQPARGRHEVVINAPDPVVSLADLEVDQVELAVDVWRERMRAHADHAAYVHVIVNERREAGASLPHTHAQIYAMDFVPAQVARERERFGAYAQRTMGGNLLQDLVQEEVKLGDRIVAIDREAVLMVPYGARFPYQLMLAPRTPRARFEDDGPTGAALLHDGLSRLARRMGASPPLNLWLRTAPRGADHFCWRIDVVPRVTNMAGLELGTGVHLNIVSPERAAADLRDV